MNNNVHFSDHNQGHDGGVAETKPVSFSNPLYIVVSYLVSVEFTLLAPTSTSTNQSSHAVQCIVMAKNRAFMFIV